MGDKKNKKKRRVSTKQSETRSLHSDKGKSGAESRGVGSGSRRDFSLPSQWDTDVSHYESGRDREKIISPGKTLYHHHSKVKDTLRSRGNELCLQDSSEEGSTAEHSEFEASPAKKAKSNHTSQTKSSPAPVIERQLFVCELTQISDFVESLNQTSKCSTNHCNGILVPAKVETVGLGGSVTVMFMCNGCQGRNISFKGTSLVEGSRRTVIGLSLAVAFIVCGNGFAKFNKTLNQCLGIPAISKNRFYEVLVLMYPHINDILTEMCDEEKAKMKPIPDNNLGSWSRAVVTSDGVWHTRGHFSKNGSFIIKNYLTGGLLWFGHKCMRGNDDEDLFEGTSKSMEGALALECFRQCKEEGCNVAVVWQDADSSAKNSVEEVFGAEPQRVYKCGGHVGRAHGNNLNDLAKIKQFSAGLVSLWKKTFPEMENLKCHCTRHSQTCGCLTKQFILNAKINHYCCLQQCKDAGEYARRLRALSKYHSQDIHSWKGGECGFHPSSECSCGKCERNNYKCKGKPYSTGKSHQLTCKFHHMAYRIECERRANDASSVIHPEMGRGQSNLCEAHFSVLPHFRTKSQSLCRLHYITSTNCGLAQGNMTWCHQNRGESYHWLIDLYRRLKLPVTTAVVDALSKTNRERMAALTRKKSEEGKKKRICQKIARTEEQQERRKFSKRQALIHTYGADDPDIDDEDGGNETAASEAEHIVGSDDRTIVSGRKCKCGSTTHLRTSHSSCKLNKKGKSDHKAQ